jgi:DNA-binding NarL/FixJ family response regulator
LVLSDDRRKREEWSAACRRALGPETLARSGNGFEAERLVREIAPGLVLLSTRFAGVRAFDLVSTLQKERSRPRILLVAERCLPYPAFLGEKARVEGFLDEHTAGAGDLEKAIANVASGKTYYSQSFIGACTDHWRDPNFFGNLLTSTHMRIMEHVADLRTDEQIHKSMGIAVRTVQGHRAQIKRKVGVNSRTELERYAQRQGFGLLRADEG